MHTNSIDSVDLDALLEEALENLASAKASSEEAKKRSAENIHLLESVVTSLNHIKKRREDSGILAKK